MRQNSRLITIACLGMVSFGIVYTTLGAALPAIIARFGLDTVAAGGLLALVSFGVLGGSLSFGPLVDRQGYKGMLVFAFAAIVVALEVVAFARSLAVLRAALLLVGYTGGMVNGGVNALTADVAGEKRSSTLTFVGAFFGVGAAGVPLLLATLSDTLPHTTILAATGAFVIVPLVFTAWTAFPESKQPHGFPVHDAKRLLGNPLLLLIGVMLFLESGIETIVGGWTPALFVSELHAPLERAPIYLSIFWLGLLLGRLALSAVLRSVGGAEVVLTSIVVAVIGALLVVGGPGVATAAVGVFLLGAGFASTFPVMFGVVGERFAHLSGTALGIVMAMALLGGMTMPYATGILAARYGLRAAFIIVPVSLIVLGIMVALLARRLWHRGRPGPAT